MKVSGRCLPAARCQAAGRVMALMMAAVIAAGMLAVACTSGGDGAGSSGTASTSGGAGASAVSAGMLAGVVHGGQAPIVGASVTLYEAGTSPGAAASVLGTATTDSLGDFSFSNVSGNGGLCGTGGLLYVVASGGSAGGQIPANSAINLMAAVGSCNSLPGYAVVNELTTVAAVYALDGFISVGSGGSETGTVSGCVDCTLVSGVNVAGSSPGLSNAFNTAALLADVTTGNPPSATGSVLPPASECTTAGNGPVNCAALETLTGLADALAACVNSLDGSTSSQCQDLFECVVPNATYNAGPPQSCTPPDGSTLPGDTLAATLLVARNPGLVSTQGLVSIPGEQVVFAPGLTTAPNDWTIALSTSVESPWPVAIDAQGNVWVAALQGTTITELSPSGATLNTFQGNGYAEGIAIDGSGNVWVAQSSDGGITEIPGGTTGVPGTPTRIDTGSSFEGIAADPAGDVWATNAANDTVIEINSVTGEVISGTGFSGGGVVANSDAAPSGIAIDTSRDVWVTTPSYLVDSTVGAVTEFSSAGTASANSPITGGGIDFPEGIAIDPTGDVWVVDTGTSAVTKLEPSGPQVTQVWTSASSADGLEYPAAIAVDAAGTGWVAGSGGVSALGSTGTLLTPNNALTGGEIYGANGVAVDASGDVWVTDSNNNLVTEFIGAAVPTVTPLVAQITPSQ